jgi:hypothetical protein
VPRIGRPSNLVDARAISVHLLAFLFDVVTRLAQGLKLASEETVSIPTMRDDVIDYCRDVYRTPVQAHAAEWMLPEL